MLMMRLCGWSSASSSSCFCPVRSRLVTPESNAFQGPKPLPVLSAKQSHQARSPRMTTSRSYWANPEAKLTISRQRQRICNLRSMWQAIAPCPSTGAPTCIRIWPANPAPASKHVTNGRHYVIGASAMLICALCSHRSFMKLRRVNEHFVVAKFRRRY